MSGAQFAESVARLLESEPTEHQIAQRELARSVLAGRAAPLVLFGAGALGRKTAAGLRAEGIPVAAFADNNPELVGTEVEELPVVSTADAARSHLRSGVAVVTIWRSPATETMQERVALLHQSGFRRVLPFYYLFWERPSRFLPHYSVADPTQVRQEAHLVRSAAALFSETKSRRRFLDHLHWRLDPEAQSLTAVDDGLMYFDPRLYRRLPNESYVDGGAFDGDTLQQFVSLWEGGFSRALAFEPDATNLERLTATVNGLPTAARARVAIHRWALGAVSGDVSFDATGNEVSHVTHTGATTVRCETLDSILKDEPATLIKMDIEGSEHDAICGARDVIKRDRPVLTLATYHRQSDLWRNPLQIAAAADGYDFYLRSYTKDGNDLVLYAIPHERRI